MEQLRNFLRNERGAVTVVWVALTAVIVILGVAIVTDMRTNMNSAGGDLDGELKAEEPNTAITGVVVD